MYAFMTTGTIHFLQQFKQEHPDKDFHFMNSGTKGLLYYEDKKKKSIFASGKRGEILTNNGEIASDGFVVMYHIPVSDGDLAIFENKANSALQRLENHPNILATRFIKEVKSTTYIIILQWKEERDYYNWKRLASEKGNDFSNMAKLPAYFANRPFTKTFDMIEEEKEK